jgi:uncharacterized membrane protein YsdA (DUF1294 family)/cold shock CspA family protein
MAPESDARIDGTLTSWNDQRGFGYLTPAEGGLTIWVHIKAFELKRGRPHEGEKFTFEIEQYLDGSRQARSVRAIRVPNGAKPKRRFLAYATDVVGLLAIPAFAGIVALVCTHWHVPIWIAWIYVVLSVFCYIVYSVDKTAATNHTWRVSENALLAWGLVGGWPGAIIAQRLLRHKTRKASFVAAFWGTVMLNVALFMVLGFFVDVSYFAA